MDIIIENGSVFAPQHGSVLDRMDVVIRGGRVFDVARTRRRRTRQRPAQIIDATGCAVIPGFVHGHLHACQTLFRHEANNLPLLPWLKRRIWPLEAAHDAASMRASADLTWLELMLSGATGALDMGSVHWYDEVFASAAQAGFRLCGGKAMMDQGDAVPTPLLESTDASLAESTRLAARWSGASDGLLTYAFAPRFALSCSPGLLRTVATLVGEGVGRLHTHASEHPDECAAVQAQTGATNVDYFAKLGMLSDRCTLAHGVHLSTAEVDVLARARTVVCHCPSSNLKLASGIADVPALRRAGIDVAIGADGAPCNNALDMFREMRLAALLATRSVGAGGLPADQILGMATHGGARAMGLGEQTGTIEVGKAADICVVDLSGPHLAPNPASPGVHLAEMLVYGAERGDVRDVVIAGKIVVRERRCLTLDSRRVVERAREHAARVWRRAQAFLPQ